MIPNSFHFCYGFDDKPAEFLFAHYLAVKSAVMVNKPDKCCIYYETEPTGSWWQAVQDYAKVVKVQAPREIFGRPLLHFAHRADVYRLQRLFAVGGIYMDLDTICIRPFSKLLRYEMVMGQQINRKRAVEGLCNAVMLAEANSVFLGAWLESYRSFRSRGRAHFWDEHSVRVPWALANGQPSFNKTALPAKSIAKHIKIMPYESFFRVGYHETGLLYQDKDVDIFADSFCVHLWEQMDMSRVAAIQPDAPPTSAYMRLAVPFITEKEKAYVAASKA